MNENRNYYLRLDEHFFDSDEMKYIQSMEDGYLYSDILMKLYLCSIKDDGFLAKNGAAYSPEKLAVITGHNTDTVTRALAVLTQEGFIGRTKNGTYYLQDFQEHIGSSASEAERKRRYRARIAADKARTSAKEDTHAEPDTATVMSHTENGTLSRECDGILEIEIEKEIEKKTELKPETDNTLSVCGKEKRGKGKAASGFIPPTLTELTDFAVSNGILPRKEAELCYYYYESQSWKKANGQKVSDWRGCVRTWSRKEGRYGRAGFSPPANPNVVVPSFDYAESEKYCL